MDRRNFIYGAGSIAFAGLAASVLGCSHKVEHITNKYGPLLPDSNGLLDLPAGFNYQVISSFAEPMNDGFHVPDRADGMGCLPLTDNRVVLIRNHELSLKHLRRQPDSIQSHKSALSYDSLNNGVALPGGTTNIVYNLETQQVEQEFMSLTGTLRNCSGGITPWNSWLTCEESVEKANNKHKKDHGYIFEIPATTKGLIEPKPLKAMGRFNHEAAAVDPQTGTVYLTEDRGDSLFYRFVPNVYGELDKGGQLQALVFIKHQQFDTRNWSNSSMKKGIWYQTKWINITDPESPNDDLRKQGYELGAALFARGEGVHWADKELYFCCTNGGAKQIGQIMRYRPTPTSDIPLNEVGDIQLFLESESTNLYNFGDNLTVMPHGDLLVCEDQYTDVVDNHLRGVTPQGELYNFAKLNAQTELAGACFSPDGKVLFVNVYSPTKTLAIRGPW